MCTPLLIIAIKFNSQKVLIYYLFWQTFIEEKLQEEKVFRAKKSVMEANRDKRAKPSGDNKNFKREETPLDKTEPGNLVNYHNI